MAKRERVPMPPGFWTIWTTVALDLVGFGIVAPILGRYAERFGANGFQVGMLFASFSLAQMVCAPLLGRLSDRIGRKPVIIVSLVGTAIGSVVTGAAGSLWVLFLGRVIDGASGASVSVAQGAVTDIAPPERRAQLLGMLGAAFGVGFVLGPALGGLAALGGPHIPFFIAGAIAGINAIAAFIRLPETKPKSEYAAAQAVAADSVAAISSDGARRSSTLLRFAVVTFVATVGFSGFESTFSLFGAKRFDFTEGSAALVFLFVGAVLVATQGALIGPLTSRVGSHTLLQSGFVLVAIGLATLAWSTVWPGMLAAVALLAFGQGIASPSITSLVADAAPPDRRGEALGFQQSAGALARVAGPLLAGVLFDHVGIGAPYVVAGIAFVVALAVVPR